MILFPDPRRTLSKAFAAALALCGSVGSQEVHTAAPTQPPQPAQNLPAPDCLRHAAEHYRLPLQLVQAILKTEGGKVGMAVRNANGSLDLGPMQINTIWLSTLQAHGITLPMLRDDYCVNVAVGSWILARALQRLPANASTGQVWQAIASYHSLTPQFNVRYAQLLWRRLKSGQGQDQP